MAQPFAAHARIGGASAHLTAGMAPTPSQVGIGFDYALRQILICNCGCLADPVCDGATDILDVVGTVDVAFRNAPSYMMPDCQGLGRTDADCSGNTDVLDVVKMVNVAFRGAAKATEFCAACTQ
jgi:hypothetical protein